MIDLHHPTSSAVSLPESRRAELEKQLADNERLMAWMEGDLDASLHFTQYLLVVSNTRILAKAHDETAWHEFRFRKGLTLQRHDHAGIGSLELFDGESRLACWRYTLAQNAAAQRMEVYFEQQLADFLAGHTVSRAAENICPNCQTPLAPGQEECPVCSVETHTPPSTWVLFRLWQFARPYQMQLLTGFALTLVSTAATMVSSIVSVRIFIKGLALTINRGSFPS